MLPFIEKSILFLQSCCYLGPFIPVDSTSFPFQVTPPPLSCVPPPPPSGAQLLSPGWQEPGPGLPRDHCSSPQYREVPVSKDWTLEWESLKAKHELFLVQTTQSSQIRSPHPCGKTFRTRETLNLSPCEDSSTNTSKFKSKTECHVSRVTCHVSWFSKTQKPRKSSTFQK